MGDNRLELAARAALGIGIGAMLAMLVPIIHTGFAATVGLADPDPIAAKVIACSVVIWFVCRFVQVRH